MTETLPWLVEAKKHLGKKEVPGPGVNAWIKAMWHSLKGGAWYWIHFGKDDSKLPWCGGFMAKVMKDCGIAYPANYASAKAWAAWGTRLATPIYGCVVVFERAGGGHVGFAVGKDSLGRLMVLGGNQNDKVSVAPFDKTRAVAYRWPPGQPFTGNPLPLLTSTAKSSTDEA